MSDVTSQCILLFTKWPQAGAVKTRLAETIGMPQATGLYRCFVEDTVANLTSGPAQLVCCYHPPDRETSFRQWLGPRLSYVPQSGTDLGARLPAAFNHAFAQGFAKVMALGTDCPDLPVTYLDEAWQALDRHDAVIGSTYDGGYYLIGFSSDGYRPGVFEGIAWSTDAVFDQTQQALATLGARVHILPPWSDVDTLADLESLLNRHWDTESRASRTVRFWQKAQSVR